MALLAGKPDALDPGQPFGRAHGANRYVDLALELLRRCEGFDRERDNGMTGICRLARLLDEIDDVSPERCRIENSGEKPDDQAQAITLVIANRDKEAFIGALGIGNGL